MKSKNFEVSITFKTILLFSPNYVRERPVTQGDAIENVKAMFPESWFQKAFDEGCIVEFSAEDVTTNV